MILISASDNNSWRYYRLRVLAQIRTGLRSESLVRCNAGPRHKARSRTGDSQALPFPESPRQVNAGKN